MIENFYYFYYIINQTERFQHDFKNRKFFAFDRIFSSFGMLLINISKYLGLDFEHERPRDGRWANPISSVIEYVQVFVNKM